MGGGISGISAASFLAPYGDVTLFEALDYLGGHTDTHSIENGGESAKVDSGFIVFNRQNYPKLAHWFDENGVETKHTCMSFGYSSARGLEYGTSDLGALFAQTRNATRPKFLQMLYDILKFYREAQRIRSSDDRSVEMFLQEGNYSRSFTYNHLLPMCAALWSASSEKVKEIPILHVAAFMSNHGLTTLGKRPTWEVVIGGSCRYVHRFLETFSGRVRLSNRVRSIRRNGQSVVIESDQSSDHFDYLVLACHADQALAILDASQQEREILGAFDFQSNRTVVHSDPSVMPSTKKAWSSWNVYENAYGTYSFTYWMNQLQLLTTSTNYFVTLNPAHELDNVWLEREYTHPIYSLAAKEAQGSKQAISGFNRTAFAGAYWNWGFHEDGFASGVEAGEEIREMARC